MDESPKARLKVLRDKLAAAVPRARLRPNAPRELLQRLDVALKHVGNLYLLSVSKKAPADSLGDAIDDALVEGHLLLHEVERLGDAPAPPQLSRGGGAVERRQHERHDTHVTVKLLRHGTQLDDAGGVSLATETAHRSARNVSVGGIGVALSAGELPQIVVGNVVHIEVGGDAGLAPFRARAVVMRRDAAGLGLRWVEDSERLRRDIAGLLEAVRRSSRGASLV